MALGECLAGARRRPSDFIWNGNDLREKGGGGIDSYDANVDEIR